MSHFIALPRVIYFILFMAFISSLVVIYRSLNAILLSSTLLLFIDLRFEFSDFVSFGKDFPSLHQSFSFHAISTGIVLSFSTIFRFCTAGYSPSFSFPVAYSSRFLSVSTCALSSPPLPPWPLPSFLSSSLFHKSEHSRQFRGNNKTHDT